MSSLYYFFLPTWKIYGMEYLELNPSILLSVKVHSAASGLYHIIIQHVLTWPDLADKCTYMGTNGVTTSHPFETFLLFLLKLSKNRGGFGFNVFFLFSWKG